MLDKIVLQSSRALPNCNNYAIGICQDNELHLTPLKGILQMRPEFNYLEKPEKKGRDDVKNAADGIETFIKSTKYLQLFQYENYYKHSFRNGGRGRTSKAS